MNEDFYEEKLGIAKKIEAYCQNRKSCDTELEDEDCPNLEWCACFYVWSLFFIDDEL